MLEEPHARSAPGLVKLFALVVVVLAAYGSLILVARGQLSPWIVLLLAWLGWLLL